MIRLNEIQAALGGVVGWEQGYTPAERIDERLCRSESGLTFQAAHPLLTLANMRSVMPDDYPLQFPAWDASRRYVAGDRVRHGGAVWEALADGTGHEPPSDGADGDAWWAEYNVLSDFVERITLAGISKVVQEFVTRKQLDRETRSLMERRALFDGAGRLRATVMNAGKLAGFEIVPVRSMGVTAKIERVGLQMTGATGTVRLYLFHSSQPAPVRTFELDFTATNGGFQWFALEDCHLPYISDGSGAGGAWYLCYSQSELPAGMEAVNFTKDWSREPCGTCNRGSVETWREITKYLQVSPFAFRAPESFTESPALWDIARTVYTPTANHGLNCEISVGCDLTDFIVSQRHIFATAIQLQVAALALRTLALNPDVRVNRNQSNASRSDILYELDGNTQGRAGGIVYELGRAYDALRLDTQGLDRVCLSCNNHGVRYRTV